MDVYKTIKHMYPNLSEDAFLLKDEGQGVFIAEWKASEAQPSIESLQEHWDNFKEEIENLFRPDPSQLEVLEQTQADLIMALMMNGVI
jgi:DNA-binding transcriptional regulator YhcF (GntR family)